ncbi:transglutaminase family protein [Aquifex sp.]
MEGFGISGKKLIILFLYTEVVLSLLSLYDISDKTLFIFVISSFILGIFNDFKNLIKLPRIILNTVAVLGTILFLSSVSLENLIEPLSNTLLFLIAIKLLENKNIRDFYQILLLSFFGVSLGTAVFQEILNFLVFLVFVLIGINALILINFYKNDKELVVNVKFLKYLFLLSVSFLSFTSISAWIFFILLPRVDKPLFDIAGGKRGLVSGFTDEVELGKVGEIQLDRRVVFRVFGIDFKEKPYWRLSVLDTFKNNRWFRTIKKEEREIRKGGKSYTIILEPTYDRYIPVLDYPNFLVSVEGMDKKPKRLKGGFYVSEKTITKPLRITALSSDTLPEDKPISLYLRLPKDISPRIKELAQKLSKEAKTPREKIERIREFFKDFKYSLRLYYRGNPLEYFLFVSKKGNCEFFASSTAILLRLMGVPSRLVSGYYGAIKNEYGNYYIVLNAMAHVWVEAFDGEKWVRVDTTPPYVPEGVRKVPKFSLIYDALLTFWYKNIVNFTAEKQRKTFKLGLDFLRNLPKKLVNSIPYVVFFVLMVFGVYIYLREIRKTPENLYRKLLRKLKKYGINERSPERILEKMKGSEVYEKVEFVVRAYQRWKYSPVKDMEELKEAYRVLKEI